MLIKTLMIIFTMVVLSACGGQSENKSYNPVPVDNTPGLVVAEISGEWVGSNTADPKTTLRLFLDTDNKSLLSSVGNYSKDDGDYGTAIASRASVGADWLVTLNSIKTGSSNRETFVFDKTIGTLGQYSLVKSVPVITSITVGDIYQGSTISIYGKYFSAIESNNVVVFEKTLLEKYSAFVVSVNKVDDAGNLEMKVIVPRNISGSVSLYIDLGKEKSNKVPVIVLPPPITMIGEWTGSCTSKDITNSISYNVPCYFYFANGRGTVASYLKEDISGSPSIVGYNINYSQIDKMTYKINSNNQNNFNVFYSGEGLKQESNPLTFTDINSNAFSTNGTLTKNIPTIEGISPSGNVLLGSTLTVTGKGFSVYPANNIVTIGGKQVPKSDILNSAKDYITFKVPYDAKLGVTSVYVQVGDEIGFQPDTVQKVTIYSLSEQGVIDNVIPGTWSNAYAYVKGSPIVISGINFGHEIKRNGLYNKIELIDSSQKTFNLGPWVENEINDAIYENGVVSKYNSIINLNGIPEDITVGIATLKVTPYVLPIPCLFDSIYEESTGRCEYIMTNSSCASGFEPKTRITGTTDEPPVSICASKKNSWACPINTTYNIARKMCEMASYSNYCPSGSIFNNNLNLCEAFPGIQSTYAATYSLSVIPAPLPVYIEMVTATGKLPTIVDGVNNITIPFSNSQLLVTGVNFSGVYNKDIVSLSSSKNPLAKMRTNVIRVVTTDVGYTTANGFKSICNDGNNLDCYTKNDIDTVAKTDVNAGYHINKNKTVWLIISPNSLSAEWDTVNVLVDGGGFGSYSVFFNIASTAKTTTKKAITIR